MSNLISKNLNMIFILKLKVMKKQELPDARKHQQISFIKSGIRILGYGALWWSLDIAVILLILSEIVGIGEELV